MALTGSLSASGSHLDRVGVLRDDVDRDSASNRAIIGASLNGSLSSNTVTGPLTYHGRYSMSGCILLCSLTIYEVKRKNQS